MIIEYGRIEEMSICSSGYLNKGADVPKLGFNEYFEPRILGLCGFAQSGKDTVGKLLMVNLGYQRLSFADALRKGLYEFNPLVEMKARIKPQSLWERLKGEPVTILQDEKRVQDLVDELGWDVAKVKYPEIRTLMQKYGTEAGRNIHGQDCWTNIIKREIEANPYKNFVITDVRFPNELKMLEDMGATVLKIRREGVNSVNGHISDKDLDGVKYTLYNNGTMTDLSENVIAFLKNPEEFLTEPIDKEEDSLV